MAAVRNNPCSELGETALVHTNDNRYDVICVNKTNKCSINNYLQSPLLSTSINEVTLVVTGYLFKFNSSK